MFNTDLVIADQPAEGSLDDPSLRRDLEALHFVAAFDDLEINPAVADQSRDFPLELAGGSAVRPDPLEPAACRREDGQEQAGTVPVLNVGGRDLQRENEAVGFYQDVSLSSCNLLVRIKATMSGLASCANASAIEGRSVRGLIFRASRGRGPGWRGGSAPGNPAWPRAGSSGSRFSKGADRAASSAMLRRCGWFRRCG